jgi:hypothetical protein
MTTTQNSNLSLINKAFEEDKNVCPEETRLFQGDPSLFQDTNIDQPKRPLTRALKKINRF